MLLIIKNLFLNDNRIVSLALLIGNRFQYGIGVECIVEPAGAEAETGSVRRNPTDALRVCVYVCVKMFCGVIAGRDSNVTIWKP